MPPKLDEEENKILAAIREDNQITAKELAVMFNFTESTIRSKLTKIYNKLEITGDDRYKRQKLIETINGKPNKELPKIKDLINRQARCGVIIFFLIVFTGVFLILVKKDNPRVSEITTPLITLTYDSEGYTQAVKIATFMALHPPHTITPTPVEGPTLEGNGSKYLLLGILLIILVASFIILFSKTRNKKTS
jgi:hypothetical protein